jgi:hypothetical protein
MVFAIDDSPVNMLGAFDGIVAWAGNQEKVQPEAACRGEIRRAACSAQWRVFSGRATTTIW